MDSSIVGYRRPAIRHHPRGGDHSHHANHAKEIYHHSVISALSFKIVRFCGGWPSGGSSLNCKRSEKQVEGTGWKADKGQQVRWRGGQ
jgi:hypothetical protein